MEDYSALMDLPADELAANESFQNFVRRTNKKDILFWEQFINLNPSKKPDIDQAIRIVSLLRFKKKSASGIRELELDRLLYTISLSGAERKQVIWPQQKRSAKRGSSFWVALIEDRRYGVAASLILLPCLLFFSAFFFDRLLDGDSIVLQASYGEQSTFILPDSSTVILNGNTRLTYFENWVDNSLREVWLDGEAFFEVRHKGQSASDRFIVHTPGMDVEVLGTEFNVFNRDEKAIVVLNSGSVKVNISAERDTSSLMMKPDEVIEYHRENHTVTKKQANAEALTSWRKKVLVFENTPLHEVGEMIEYTYGVKVIFDDNVDINEQLVGTIPNEDLDVLLTVLAKSSNLEIVKHGKKIQIGRKTNPSGAPD